MKTLKTVVAAIQAQKIAIQSIFNELRPSAKARMGLAALDVFVAELDSICNALETPFPGVQESLPFNEDELANLLGDDFVTRVHSLSDLISPAVDQIVDAADEIRDNACKQLAKRQNKPWPKEKPQNPLEALKREPAETILEDRQGIDLHCDDYVGTSLRDMTCALQNMVEPLSNLLLGARMFVLAERMRALQPADGSPSAEIVGKTESGKS